MRNWSVMATSSVLVQTAVARSRKAFEWRRIAMKNLSQMMKQAQEMQGKMEEMQARMEGVEMTGQAGAGLVSVTLNGKGEMRGLKMDASIKDGDMEVMEDLITAAHNDAKCQ